jgi:hypothetical protein
LAKRSRESFEKRAREKARQEKQDEKRAKRQSRAPDDSEVTRAEEDALMQEFARLSARFEANEISLDSFNEQRHRILVELGLEPE